jgi:AAA domain
MALAVATGRDDLLGREVTKGRVAYIVAENPDGFRMRLMVAAYIYNIDLAEIAKDLVILDKRVTPEEVAPKLKRLAADGPFVLIIGDTWQALFHGDDPNNNGQAGEFMRRWRTVAQIKGRPAIVIATHPVKNAAADNLIPYGGGATLNEVDGNLTLYMALGGVTELHWQGKLRGAEFDPVRFRFEGLTSPDVKDVKGREVHLPVLRPVTKADPEQREKAATNQDAALLKAMRDDPSATLDVLAAQTGIHRSSIKRKLDRLAKPTGGKLVAKTLGNWTLTPAGRKAIEIGK